MSQAKNRIVLSFAVAAAALACSSVAGAQSVVSTSKIDAASSSTLQYWTPERLASARPIPLPLAASSTQSAQLQTIGGTPVSSPGAEPAGGGGDESPQQLFDPSQFSAYMKAEAAAEAQFGAIDPEAEGTLLAPYTSNRLMTTSMEKKYPYKPVGKMFFVQNGQNFVCSASVISYRIIATAGHCLHSGNGLQSGWSSNVLFVPSYRNGAAPFQSWAWNGLGVIPTDWFNGGGGVPHASDYGMFVVADRLFGTKLKKIGIVTGFLGWRTLTLARNHVHMLGYPCNLDSCEIIHEVTAGQFRSVAPNAVEYGSDMRGGSSGGPWVQNFGTPASGQTGGFNTVRNEVVAVTSYGFISLDPKIQGASIPDNRWVAVWNAICAPTGNCTKTP